MIPNLFRCILSYSIDNFNEPLITYQLHLYPDLYPVWLLRPISPLIKTKIIRRSPTQLHVEIEGQTLCVNIFNVDVCPYQPLSLNSTRKIANTVSLCITNYTLLIFYDQCMLIFFDPQGITETFNCLWKSENNTFSPGLEIRGDTPTIHRSSILP